MTKLEHQCIVCGKPQEKPGVCTVCKRVDNWKDIDLMDQEKRERDEH